MNTLIRMTPSIMLIALIAVIAAGLFGCHSVPYYETPSYQTYEQQRTHDQILQHGAGGCTPNMSTGGCL